MQAHLKQAGPSSLQLTLDREAAMTIAAALRFAGRFQPDFDLTRTAKGLSLQTLIGWRGGRH
jgi:hypothetical protein